MSLENKIFEDLVKEAAEVNELILGSKEDVDPIWDDSDLNEAIDFLILKILSSQFLIIHLKKIY